MSVVGSTHPSSSVGRAPVLQFPRGLAGGSCALVFSSLVLISKNFLSPVFAADWKSVPKNCHCNPLAFHLRWI